MAPRKTERILNLTICLLVTRQFLPKSRIREIVEGYHDLSDAAFERTFERDKDELRALGIGIQVGSFDGYFDDEVGYRIERNDFELPPIELDAAEAAVLGVAARAWQHAGLAESTRSALAKLRAAGVEPDTTGLTGLEPSVAAGEPAFEPLWRAVLDRVQVEFRYRGGEPRRLEPWGITSFHGRWYVVGLDVDRQDRRMFKLSRMSDVPHPVSAPGAYTVPADLDLRALARKLWPDEPNAQAELGLRAGRAPTLRRAGESADGAGRPLPEGFEVVRIGYADLAALADDIARYAADVVVLSPPELRTAVIERLRGVVATRSAPATGPAADPARSGGRRPGWWPGEHLPGSGPPVAHPGAVSA